MTPAVAFRTALVAAAIFVVIAIAAIINHFISPIPSPAFGLKVGLLCLAVAACCGVYANYNRPGTRV